MSMSNRELPTITTSTHQHAYYGEPLYDAGFVADSGPGGASCFGGPGAGGGGGSIARRILYPLPGFVPAESGAGAVFNEYGAGHMAARVVRVFIFDPNENLAIESRMMHKSNEKLTDLTDQELFFELPMNDILTKHNELRARTVDKATSTRFGKEVFLEPVRVGQLRMVVTTVATF